MIGRDGGEQLSAWLDGEHVPARAVLALLEGPEGIACVREILQVRAALEEDSPEAGDVAVVRIERAIARSRWSSRALGLGWVTAAVASAGLLFVLMRPTPPSTSTACFRSPPRTGAGSRS